MLELALGRLFHFLGRQGDAYIIIRGGYLERALISFFKFQPQYHIVLFQVKKL